MKKQSFIFSSAILIFSAVAAKLIGALFRIPLANMLGGTGMGYFSSAYSIFLTIYALSVTGLPTAVAKLTAENNAFGRYGNVRRIKTVSLAFFAVTGIVFTAVLLLAAYPFCRFTNVMGAVPSVIMIAPSVLFGCIMSVYRGYYEGLRNMFPTAVSQIAEGIFKLCTGLALCVYVLDNPEKFASVCDFFGYDDILPVAAAAAVLGVTVSTAAGTLFLFLRDKLKGDGITREMLASPSARNCVDGQGDIISDLLKIALPVAAGALVTNLTSLVDLITITRSLDKAFTHVPDYISGMSGISDITELSNFLFGCYTGLAITVFNLVPSFTNMFGKGIFPSITEAYAEKDTEKIQACSEKALLSTALIAVPSGMGICVLSGQILQFLFPSKVLETHSCTAPLSVLGIGVIFLCLSSTFFSIFQSAGKPQLPVKIMLVGVAVKLAANLMLVPVPQLNITGAAVSTLLCYAVICTLSMYYLIRFDCIKKRRLLVILCKICYSSVMCISAASITENMLKNTLTPSVVLLFSIFTGVIIYIFCICLLGIFTKSTIKMLIS